ncbi:DUF2786 domain-containing protein [Mycena indigotica]|uniref:DUF2786 domain-containing protein n=1 Tax=Mycena indigotica TaxID=2126181 RepID=A0A8H6S2B8_9AGAR|nr:DUF2786 domain-containing protein [Mycena indigotica]KAF7291935.1 DUF2786 domain-containing protein [Mycena indigotica]
MLGRHNVTQADIMAHESDADKLKRAGQSVVSIRSTVSPNKPVDQTTWALTLSDAMDEFFDCQSYITDFRDTLRPRLEFTFYGLAEQTVTAAHAFEMSYNLVSAWSLKPKVGKGIHKRNCYCNGTADALYKMALAEKDRDKQRAARREAERLKAREWEEAEEERMRLDRLKDPQVTTDRDTPDRKVKVEEVPDEDVLRKKNVGDEDTEPSPAQYQTASHKTFNATDKNDLDLDKELAKAEERARNRAPSTSESTPTKPQSTLVVAAQASAVVVLPKEEEGGSDSPWNSVMQLVKFRETSKAIADEYLKQSGIKLSGGRQRIPLKIKDDRAWEAYETGRERCSEDRRASTTTS